MNNLEHDLHTMFTRQAEAMEVPAIGAAVPSVGGTRSASTVPSRRWMLAAAAVVMVVGGGLALAARQPAPPPTADAVRRSVDQSAAPATNDDSGGSNRDDDRNTSTNGTSAALGDDPTPVTPTTDSTDTEPTFAGPPPTNRPERPQTPTEPGTDDDSPDSNGGGALPPICDDTDTAVKVGSTTDFVLGVVGDLHGLGFFLYGCPLIDRDAYAFEATVADPEIVAIVRASHGRVVLQLLADGITSVKMDVTDAAGNPIGSLVVPIQVHAHSGDTPGDPGSSDPHDPDDTRALPVALDDLAAIIVGLSTAEAAEVAHAMGLQIRVAELDGVAQPGVTDRRYGRYDVAVVGGIITAVLAHG